MNDKHTPGPWEASFATLDGQPIGNFAYVSKAGCSLAMVHCYAAGGSDEWMRNKAMENAHLMASSPDLKEALEDLLAAYESVMHAEGDYPGDEWTAEDRDDKAALKAISALKKARGEQ